MAPVPLPPAPRLSQATAMKDIRTHPDENSGREQPTVQIDRTTPAEYWRWACPEGHRAIELDGSCIECKSCASDESIDGCTVPYLVNQKTGEKVAGERLEFDYSGRP